MNSSTFSVRSGCALFEQYAQTPGGLSCGHQIDHSVDIIQVVKRSQMGLYTVLVAECDGLPHTLGDTTAHPLDPVPPQQDVKCIDGEIGLRDPDYHHEAVYPRYNVRAVDRGLVVDEVLHLNTPGAVVYAALDALKTVAACAPPFVRAVSFSI